MGADIGKGPGEQVFVMLVGDFWLVCVNCRAV